MAFHLETTGLNIKSDRIVGIVAVSMPAQESVRCALGDMAHDSTALRCGAVCANFELFKHGRRCPAAPCSGSSGL